MLSETVSGPGLAEALTTTYAYDANGHLIARTDPLGHTRQSEYDATGKVSAEVDPLGRRTSYAYDRQGRLITTTYPDGLTETLGYDPKGNKISATDPSLTVPRHIFGSTLATARGSGQ